MTAGKARILERVTANAETLTLVRRRMTTNPTESEIRHA